MAREPLRHYLPQDMAAQLSNKLNEKFLLSISTHEMAGIAEKHNQEVLGYGGNRIVLPLINDPTKVITIFRSPISDAHAQRSLPLNKIMTSLFPDNIPYMFAAFGQQAFIKKQLTGTIEERIYPSTSEHCAYPFSVVEEVYKYLGMPIVIDYSRDPQDRRRLKNFMVSSINNGQYYVDTVSERPGNTHLWREQKPKIIGYMGKEGYSSKAIQTVNANLDILISLPGEIKFR